MTQTIATSRTVLWRKDTTSCNKGTVNGIPQAAPEVLPAPSADNALARHFDIEAIALRLGLTSGGALLTETTVVRGAGGKACPAVPALGDEALAALLQRPVPHLSEIRQVSGTLDMDTRSMFVLFEIKGQGLSTVASITFRTDASTFDG